MVRNTYSNLHIPDLNMQEDFRQGALASEGKTYYILKKIDRNIFRAFLWDFDVGFTSLFRLGEMGSSIKYQWQWKLKFSGEREQNNDDSATVEMRRAVLLDLKYKFFGLIGVFLQVKEKGYGRCPDSE